MELGQLPKGYFRICEHVSDYHHLEGNVARYLAMIMVDYLKEPSCEIVLWKCCLIRLENNNISNLKVKYFLYHFNKWNFPRIQLKLSVASTRFCSICSFSLSLFCGVLSWTETMFMIYLNHQKNTLVCIGTYSIGCEYFTMSLYFLLQYVWTIAS